MPDTLPPSPAPPASPPPPVWSPATSRSGPAVSWDSLARLGKGVGLLLVFVGALIFVIVLGLVHLCVASPGSCTGGFSGYVGALLAAEIILVLGLGGVVAGAGIRLRWSHPMPSSAPGPDEMRFLQGTRVWNSVLLVVSLVLLFWLLIALTPIYP